MAYDHLLPRKISIDSSRRGKVKTFACLILSASPPVSAPTQMRKSSLMLSPSAHPMTIASMVTVTEEWRQCTTTRAKAPGHWVYCQKGAGHAGRHLWADHRLARFVRWLDARFTRRGFRAVPARQSSRGGIDA